MSMSALMVKNILSLKSKTRPQRPLSMLLLWSFLPIKRAGAVGSTDGARGDGSGTEGCGYHKGRARSDYTGVKTGVNKARLVNTRQEQ